MKCTAHMQAIRVGVGVRVRVRIRVRVGVRARVRVRVGTAAREQPTIDEDDGQVPGVRLGEAVGFEQQLQRGHLVMQGRDGGGVGER